MREAAGALLERVGTVDVVRQLVAKDPVDFKALDRLVPRMGLAAAGPLLDALATAGSRGTRRGLFGQLARMGAGIGPLVVERLDDERWYVTRNLLALLDELPGMPHGFSPARFAVHPDARVRWQAVKLQLELPGERDGAIVTALQDEDPRTVRLGLTVALERCPDAAVRLVVGRATNRGSPAELRVLAIRVLGATAAPAALETLLRLTAGNGGWWGRPKLPSKSPELLAALAALATRWSHNGAARAVLARAAVSDDPEIRAATDPGIGRP